MDDSYANGDPEAGEMGTCIEIYLKPDGSATVTSTQKPAPEGGEPAASLRRTDR
mgnify:CR=1 FL=1